MVVCVIVGVIVGVVVLMHIRADVVARTLMCLRAAKAACGIGAMVVIVAPAMCFRSGRFAIAVAVRARRRQRNVFRGGTSHCKVHSA